MLLWSFKTSCVVFNVVPKSRPVSPGLHIGCIKINPVVISDWLWGVFFKIPIPVAAQAQPVQPGWWGWLVWPWSVGAWTAVQLSCLCVPTSLIHAVLLNHNVVAVADGRPFQREDYTVYVLGALWWPRPAETWVTWLIQTQTCLSRKPLCSYYVFIFYDECKDLVFVWRCLITRQCFCTCGRISFMYRPVSEWNGIS